MRAQQQAIEAFERRVRPIYDALDSRNSKTALKLCVSALEKYPDSALLKALKSVAMMRTGRQAEAHKVCDELVAQAPEDEQVLHVLMLSLKDLHRPYDITTVFELAHARDPGNVEVMNGLFNSYIREGSYAKQQQVATKLNKAQPSARHAWWIILSIMLQARAAKRGDLTSALDPNKLVQLAESMVSRQVAKDGKLDGFEGLLVYLDLLVAQGRWSEAAGAVTGPLGDAAAMAAERAHLRAALSMACGDAAAAAAALQEQLRSNPDDWATLQLYCDCVLRPIQDQADGSSPSTASSSAADVATAGAPPPLPHPARGWPESTLLRLSGGLAELLPKLPPEGPLPPPQTPEEQRQGLEAAQETVRQLVELVEAPAEAGTKLTTRGPYLATVEVAQRAAQLGLVPPKAVAEAALSYVRSHGHLVSCALDLRPYTSRMEAGSAAWLAQHLSELAAGLPGVGASNGSGGNSVSRVEANGGPVSSPSPAGLKERVKAVRTWVCCQQLLDDLGLPLLSDPQQAVSRAGDLMDVYASCQELYKGLDDRERGPADELPVLAAGCLATAAALSASEQQATEHLLQAVLMLESCIRTRPYSAPMRLALAAAYTLLACPEHAMLQCRRLEIKNIQLDSLASHHLLPALLAYGPCGQDMLRVVLRDTLSLYRDHQRDAGDTLAKAYQGGAYSKVLEFVAFKERLDAAHTRAVARAERALLDILDAAQAGLESAASAARDASASLPLSELPSMLATGLARLRFNEDLGTRAAWYAPAPTAAHAAPAWWWQRRGEWSGQGSGRRWWAGPGSAEGGSAGAAAFRRGAAAAVRGRWLVCHLLQAVLAPPQTEATATAAGAGTAAGAKAGAGVATGPGATAQAPRSPAELLADLEACCVAGAQASQVDDGPEGHTLNLAERLAQRTGDLGASTASAAPSVPQQSDYDLLTLGVFTLGVRAAAWMHGPAASSSGPSADAAATASGAGVGAATAGLLVAIAERLSAAIAASAGAAGPRVAPGHVLNGAAVLLQQQLVWAGLCVQAWHKWTKQSAYRKVKGEAAVEALHAEFAALKAACTKACASLSSGLEALSAAASAAVAGGNGTLSLVAQAGSDGNAEAVGGAGAALRLWGWRGGFDAATGLKAVHGEQGKVAMQLQELAARHTKTQSAMSL